MHSIEILQWSPDRKQGKFVTSNPSIFLAHLQKVKKSVSKKYTLATKHTLGVALAQEF